MKIYVCHSKELNFQDDLYDPLRKSKLNSLHEIFLPHESREKWDFVTKDIIKNSDIVIAEVSLPGNFWLGIEIGWTNAFDRKIICIYREGSKISGSLKFVCENFIEYTDKEDMIEKLEKALSSI
ncbi:MAG: hypothetical protein ACD_4C00344G0002 [uncultured bacterium (gcode 4)]|uniref:Nucleoside 2-deoxyribosyltransferase n=1 Tax=uncultured bacterium (gcode 4) TaxID=1234023 RepID=K2FWL6_9BACT|nr:MAG: hypothetical protein ACD_4C00344G0002 [uncultured bacterium (gcode 4)]